MERHLRDLVPPDAAGNRVIGEAVLVDVGNTYIQSDGRMIAAIGLDNLLIIDTPDLAEQRISRGIVRGRA